MCGLRRGDYVRGLCRHKFDRFFGPNAITVKRNATWNGPPYGLVKLTPEVMSILEEYGPRTLSAIFGDRRPPPEIRFGIGDVVSVSIFEAAAGGLFIPSEAGVRPGNFVTLAESTGRHQRNDFSPVCRVSAHRR